MAAEGTKLQVKFLTNEEKTATYSYSYAKDPETESVTAQQIKTFMDAMIANTSTLENTLVAKKSAELITTSVIEYDLSDNESTGMPLKLAVEKGLVDLDGEPLDNPEYFAKINSTD